MDLGLLGLLCMKGLLLLSIASTIMAELWGKVLLIEILPKDTGVFSVLSGHPGRYAMAATVMGQFDKLALPKAKYAIQTSGPSFVFFLFHYLLQGQRKGTQRGPYPNPRCVNMIKLPLHLAQLIGEHLWKFSHSLLHLL